MSMIWAMAFTAQVIGKASHAGTEPEKGINAIMVAAQAIAALETGRLDEATTANFGLISGGTATNVVPAPADRAEPWKAALICWITSST